MLSHTVKKSHLRSYTDNVPCSFLDEQKADEAQDSHSNREPKNITMNTSRPNLKNKNEMEAKAESNPLLKDDEQERFPYKIRMFWNKSLKQPYKNFHKCAKL